MSLDPTQPFPVYTNRGYEIAALTYAIEEHVQDLNTDFETNFEDNWRNSPQALIYEVPQPLLNGWYQARYDVNATDTAETDWDATYCPEQSSTIECSSGCIEVTCDINNSCGYTQMAVCDNMFASLNCLNSCNGNTGYYEALMYPDYVLYSAPLWKNCNTTASLVQNSTYCTYDGQMSQRNMSWDSYFGNSKNYMYVLPFDMILTSGATYLAATSILFGYTLQLLL